jgi:hypothetical protein
VSPGAVRWSCARCLVSVGQIDGTPTRLPATWSSSGDSIFCLTCSRALAGEAAMDSAPDACTGEDRIRLRREALIRFEIDRTPLAQNREIANACRTSPKTVANVRDMLEAASADPVPTAAPGRI